jgi:hypothetical protein
MIPQATREGKHGGGGEVPRLRTNHRDELHASGLSDAQIEACGFYSLGPTATDELRTILNWSKPGSVGKLLPGWAIPFPRADGTVNGYARVKLDNPRRDKNNKPIKYESPLGVGNRAYFPPGTIPALADPAVPLVVTEGEKKAAKADQDGFPCVGLVGVYGWQKPRAKGQDGKKRGTRELIDDLAGVAWAGRTIYIVFDSDAAEKPGVRWAEWYLAEALKARGANVLVVRLPAGEGGAKVGVDDFLVAHGPAAFRAILAAAAPPVKPIRLDNRPVVLISPDEHEVIAATVKALADRDDGLYQRGGELAIVTRDPRPTKRLRPSGSPRIIPVRLPHLRTRVARHVQFVQRVETKDGATDRRVHPPRWLVEGVAAATAWPGIPVLEAVTETPTLRPDGTVLQTQGYDEQTGVLYQPSADFPPVPDEPTRADAERARAELLEAVCDFPFASAAHRAAWLAGLLTPLARFAFHGPAPLFLIDANTRAAGKGLLADTIGVIAAGRDLARAAYSPDDDEMRKVITSVAVSGERLILLDNIADTIGGAAFDAMLTATDWSDRWLGTNKLVCAPLVATWYATANNAALRGDTGRRVCHVRLESDLESPEERTGFRHPDLLAWVRQERGRLLVAALTILAAYCRAGRPGQDLPPWGSYEAWTGLVRAAVVWVGLPDPGLTRLELAKRADTDGDALRGLIAGWAEADPTGCGRTVAAVLKELDADKDQAKYPTLRAVLAGLFDLPPGKLPSAPRLGKRLHHFAGRVAGGRCLDSRPGHGGAKVWFVRDLTAASGGSGGSGGGVSPTHACGGQGGEEEIVAGGENTPTTPTTPTTADPDGGCGDPWLEIPP